MRKKHPERDIQNAILEWLKWQKDCVVMEIDTQGIYNRRLKTFLPKKPNAGACFFRGVSDIIVCHKTLGFVAIEVKSKTGVLSDVQKEFRDAIIASGGKHLVAKSIEDVEYFFKLAKSTTSV